MTLQEFTCAFRVGIYRETPAALSKGARLLSRRDCEAGIAELPKYSGRRHKPVKREAELGLVPFCCPERSRRVTWLERGESILPRALWF